MVALVCVEAYEECVAMFAYRFYRKRQTFFCKIYHDFSFPAGALPRLCFLNVEIVEIVEIGLFD